MKQINVTYPNGDVVACPFGIEATELVGHFGELKAPLVAVLVNNELRPIESRLIVNCTLEPVTIDTTPGASTYRRSLCFLLAIAARETFPGRRLVAGMSIGTGFYHFFDDDTPLDDAALAALEARMRELVERDIDIKLEWFSYADAMTYFKKTAQADTLLLLEHLNDSVIAVNECAGFRDLHVAPLVPNSGILKTFELKRYHSGFLLRYPHKETPNVLEPFADDPVLYKIATEYRTRNRILGISSVGALDKISSPKSIRAFIPVAEALQNKKIAEIADLIAKRADKVKCVMIAGPSSSGKTTTSKKLAIQLQVAGFVPLVIELDSYFVNRDRTPKDANGEFDFECLEALDVEYLNQQLLDLFAGKEIELPEYDFKAGARKASGKFLKMTGREILIMEGIHGLNDKLTPRIPREQKFKVYVSALTQLNLDDHNRISTTDNRLLRRIVRDYQFRGHSAKDTLKMWDSVGRGERLHIFPYQNTADAAFNSALEYEIGVLKIYADPLLRAVKPMDDEYAEAKRLLSFLDNFSPIPAQFVPRDSILREFIGESEFKY